MTITEKILAAHADLAEVRPGQIISAKVDMIMANDMAGVIAIDEFHKIKGAKIFDPQKVVIVLDHCTPGRNIADEAFAKKVREFAIEHHTLFYEAGRGGIEHVLLPEQGLARPGQLVIGADSHTCTYGALGLFATGVGSTDTAVAWALGTVWLKVPPTMRIILNGKKRPWVSGKDIILYLLGHLGVDGARYRALEFYGETMNELSVAERLTMANMVIEAGAKNGIFAVDSQTEEYVKATSDQPYMIYRSDPDAEYVQTLEFDLEDIEPQVAFPHLPSNTKPISQVGQIVVDQVVIGSCTNGRIEDLRIAANLLKGKKIYPRVRCIVIPGSQKVYYEALKEGLIDIFIEAECVVSTPMCGPCGGGDMGTLCEGERCLSTTNRNFVGRMGHAKSEVYLASPAVAAATALCGYIAGPDQI
ncbi:MAG TPA: 3-isopropylmalate dehydratase large subunit [Firmicutes bacterium]|nr:3-isopropylmalate dehydratase large subunit [Bacillota bacterium]